MARAKFNTPVLTSLTFRETVQLLRTLNGGAAGFDYGQRNLADLRAIAQGWCDAGHYSQATLEAAIAEIIAARPVKALPAFTPQAAPTVSALPPFGAAPVAPVAAAIAAPIVAQPAHGFAPALPPFGAAPIAAAIAPAAPVEAASAPTVPPPPAAAPIAAPAPVQASPAITLGQGVPRRVLARSLFPDQPLVQQALDPALTVMVYDDPQAPAIRPGYIFAPAHVVSLFAAASCKIPMRLWLVGPKGTGKTTCVEQLAARMGRQLFRVNFNRATEAADVLGDMGLLDMATRWQDGPVAMALRTPGAVLLLDEITYASAGHTSALNPVLEHDGPPVRLPRTGEVLHTAPDVFILAADNTAGNGDESGDSVARLQLGPDTRNRFHGFITFGYLPADDEARAVRGMVADICGRNMKLDAARAVVKMCSVARAKADAGELVGAPSLRNAAAFACFVAMGVPPAQAWTQCVVTPAPLNSAEELRGIFAAHFPPDFSITKFFN